MPSETKTIKAFIFNEMLKNPNLSPQIDKDTVYSDKEVDSIRAKWILEEIKRRKANQPEMKIQEFLEKYKLKHSIRTIYYILENNTSNRKKKGHVPSFNDTIKRNMLEYKNEMRKISMNEKWDEERIHLKNKGYKELKEATLAKLNYMAEVKDYIIPSKSPDGKLTVFIVVWTNKKNKERLVKYKFEDYNQCMLFLMGYSIGISTGKIRALKRWEFQALEAYNKRKGELHDDM